MSPQYLALLNMAESLLTVAWSLYTVRLSWGIGSGDVFFAHPVRVHLLRHVVVVVLDKVQGLLTMVKVGEVSLHSYSWPMLGKGSEWATAQIEAFWGKEFAHLFISVPQNLEHTTIPFKVKLEVGKGR